MIALIGKGVYIVPAAAKGSTASLGEILTVIGATVVVILVGMALIVLLERRSRKKSS